MGSLDDILNRVVSSRIFKCRNILRPDYVPDELPHRETQILRLGSILAPILKGERPSNVLIYGLPGTGKTAVTKYVLRKFSEKAGTYNVPFTYAYINCRRIDTPYQVLAETAKSIGVKVPFTGLSTAEVYRRLVRGLESSEKTLLVVLDEIDYLIRKHGDDLLYRLVRINEELNRSGVIIIGITNDVKVTEPLDPRVKSSLSEEELVFPPYDALQLEDILESRARDAFYDGVLEDGVIPLCSALAAREHGDARRALDLLRVAGEIAEREGESRVREYHVRIARDELERDKVVELIKTMPLHGKLVVAALLKAERKHRIVTTGDVYKEYKSLCEALDIEVLTTRRISDIINELNMLGILSAKVESRGRHGRTKIIRLIVPRSIVREALCDEPRLEKHIKSGAI